MTEAGGGSGSKDQNNLQIPESLAFEFSPPKHEALTDEPIKHAIEPQSELVLAPFSSVPDINFVNGKLGVPIVQRVCIRNPTKSDLHIKLEMKKELPKMGFTFSFENAFVPKHSVIMLEIRWTPREFGQSRDLVYVGQANGKKKFGHIVITSSSFPFKQRVLRKYTEKRISGGDNILKSIENSSFLDCPVSPIHSRSFKINQSVLELPSILNHSHQSQGGLNKSYNSLEDASTSSKYLLSSTVTEYEKKSFNKNSFSKDVRHPTDLSEKQNIELIKWVNSILSPPEEFEELENEVDPAKHWERAIGIGTDLLAPSKEFVSIIYLRNEQNLATIQKASITIFKSEQISSVLKALEFKSQEGLFAVKDDIDLRFNQGARSRIVELVMLYNPLWLRIGLEAIYGYPIPMSSKTLTRSLLHFLKTYYLFNQPMTEFSKTQHLGLTFKTEFHNVIIFNFMALVYFLDKIKLKRIIPYDPCLFLKKSPIKKSETMWLEFVKEYIKCVGQMNRTMAQIGYTLTYEQSYLDEYDFSVKSHNDLRDGIHLTRAVEIILKDMSLSKKLRCPAISRLQKIHNVNIAFDSLIKAGFEIKNVTTADVVNGNKQKIMSLIWQLLYNFLAPRYEKSAIVIQRWWRRGSLERLIRKRIASRIIYRNSIVLIQRWWRRKQSLLLELRRINSAIIIQNWYRQILLTRKQILAKQICSAKLIQNWYRSNKDAHRTRKKFLAMKSACCKIQMWYRNLRVFRSTKKEFEDLKRSTIIIQKRYRSLRSMREERFNYCIIKSSALRIQTWYRSVKTSRQCRDQFLKKKLACAKIQLWYRSLIVTRVTKKHFDDLRCSALIIQVHFRALLAMRKEMSHYQAVRTSAIKIQTWYRSIILGRGLRKRFFENKIACVKIQNWYRGMIATRLARKHFEDKRNSALIIQVHFRALLAMRKEMSHYQAVRTSVIKIQTWYRSVIIGREMREWFLENKIACIKIQNWYRGLIATRLARKHFEDKRNSALIIQVHFRALLAMRKEMSHYQAVRTSVIKIQTWYRSVIIGREMREWFLENKIACVKIQNWYRGLIATRLARKHFENMRRSAITIQSRYRALLAMRNDSLRYRKMKSSVQQIEDWYLSMKTCHDLRNRFIAEKSACVKIQQWYRSLIVTRSKKMQYDAMKRSVIIIQNRYRALVAMRNESAHYQAKRARAIQIQMWYRSIIIGREERERFLEKKNASIKIQNWYRSITITRSTKERFDSMKHSAYVIQTRFRAMLAMRNEMLHYRKMKASVLLIEDWYQRMQWTKILRYEFLQKRMSTIVIQNWFRSIKNSREFREKYLREKTACLKIQRWYRCAILTREMRMWYCKLRNSTIKIQCHFRAFLVMRNERQNYCQMRESTLKIQVWYRSLQKMISERNNFQLQRNAALVIQRQWRNHRVAKAERIDFLLMKQSAIIIQKRFRLFITLRVHRGNYQNLRENSIKIQRWYRNLRLMKTTRQEYIKMREVTVKIQRSFRTKQRNKVKSIILIQALWRGYCARKACSIILEKHQRKQKTLSLNEEAKMRLSLRYKNYIEMLSNTTAILPIVKIFDKFGFLTSYSKEVCVMLVNDKRLLTSVWQFLDAQCRSLPYQQLYESILDVLLNCVSCSESLPFIWEDMVSRRGYLILVNLMVKFYSVNTSLFCKSASILWQLARDRERMGVMYNSYDTANILRYCILKISKQLKPNKGVIVKEKYGFSRKQFVCPTKALAEIAKIFYFL